VDAIEYYFSTEGTLSRLGKRQAQTHAGPLAMEHVGAQEHGVIPAVHLWFRDDADKFDEARAVGTSAPPLPAAARLVLSSVKLPFIIRGYELRSFVEDNTPENRYKEIASWFALDPLLTIQQNLRTLRRQIKKKAESNTKETERLRDLKLITTNAITAWDEAKVCRWFNTTMLAPLDEQVEFAALSTEDAGFRELTNRKSDEDEQVGLGPLKRLGAHLKAVFTDAKDHDDEPSGLLADFEKAVASHEAATRRESEERSKVSKAVFNDVWAAAKKIFEATDVELDTCPVCDTPLKLSPAGARANVVLRLEAKLNDLETYREAERQLTRATTSVQGIFHKLMDALETVSAELKEARYDKKAKAIVHYLDTAKPWNVGNAAPESQEAMAELTELLSLVSEETDRIVRLQGEHTYAKAFETANRLIEIKLHLSRIRRTKTELQALHEELNRQARIINKAVVEHAQYLVTKLQKDVDSLYKEIQGGNVNAPPIRLELPGEDDVNQQRIQLLIDFAKNRKGVVPSGYLSDSQIHTLALALRLSAIRMFNDRFPVVVLDDVVTSYDADHRKNIAAVLAKYFEEFQIIVVTHDELFFNLLQDHLSSSRWAFRRITKIESEFGPSFHDHRTPDEAIQAKLDAGQSAAAEMRQAEEEWLLDICRGFGVKVVMRPVDRPYQFDRGELAGALASFLKGAGLLPPEVPGISNTFLSSLQKGVIENFASHFSDNPFKASSIGDEKARWVEFRYFRDQFVCGSCGKRRFKRPSSLKKPVCAKCETPFSF